MRRPLRFALASSVCFLAPLRPPSAAALEDDFAAGLDPAVWTASTPLYGAQISCPVEDPEGTDGQVLELLYPGPTSPRRYGPRWATEVETAEPRGYGWYEARLKTATASSREGVVSAFFTYFNDGTDYDGDGITDNSEIDFELLAAEPTALYLTVWTEYQEVDGVEVFYHTTRKVDLATGQVWQTAPGQEGEYGNLEALEPLDWSLPGFDASSAYRTYAFEWTSDRVTFWIDAEDGAGPRLLWQFDGEPDVSIPTLEAYAMFNLWHNQSAWDTGLPASPPRQAVTYRVDRVALP